jgi:hypothetical protein
MRSMVEGFFNPDSEEPLHRASRAPPSPRNRGEELMAQ